LHAIAQFRKAFDELPVRERRVAVLLHVNNLTSRETGKDPRGLREPRLPDFASSNAACVRLQAYAPLLLEVV